MLRMHETPDTYCVLFDVHDDIVTIDDSVSPSLARFYQVKTKTTGNWTPHALTVQASGEDGTPLPSHLGKLYDHRLKFAACVERLTFVSNARLSVLMADGSKGLERDSICLADIDATELATICDKLDKEHSLGCPASGMESTHFDTTPLSVQDHDTHCEGAVSTFLGKQGDGTIAPGPFHKALKSEIQRRSTKEGLVSSFADMVKQRGLSRDQLQSMIDSVLSQRKQEDLVSLIRGQIIIESFDLRQQQSMLGDARKFLAHRLDATNLVLADATMQVTGELAAAPASVFNSAKPLTDTISYLSARPNKAWQQIRDRYSDGFLRAMFAVMIYEQHQLPATDTQPSEENP